MQQGSYSTSSQQKPKIWYAVGSAGFSFLLFLAIGLIILSLEGFRNFYQEKAGHLGQTSIEAIMPASQETDKVYGFLEKTDHKKIEKREAILADSVLVKVRERISTKLLIFDGSSQPLTCTLGSLGGKNSIVLPYIFKSFFGMKLNQLIQFQIGDVNYIYHISGFYEDAILSQQEVENRIAVYLDPASYAELKEVQEIIPGNVVSLQLANPENTDEVLKELKSELSEQLFINGLDLELYGSQDIESNVNLYVHYVKLVSTGLGVLFLMVAVIALAMIHRNWYRGNATNQKSFWMTGVEAGVIPFAGAVLLLCGPWLLSRLIVSLGYTFHTESSVLCLVLTCLVYCLIIATITLVNLFLGKTKKETKVQRKKGQGSLLKLSIKSISTVFVVSFILATATFMILRVYSSTLGDTDLFYEYDDDTQVIEVFHSTPGAIQESHELNEITEYAKPVIQAAIFGGMIGLALLYAITLFQSIGRIQERLNQSEESNLRRQALPVLGLVLAATLAAFLLGLLVSYLCKAPLLDLLRLKAGVSVDSLAINQILVLMLFGGAAIIAGGVTLGVVR